MTLRTPHNAEHCYPPFLRGRDVARRFASCYLNLRLSSKPQAIRGPQHPSKAFDGVSLLTSDARPRDAIDLDVEQAVPGQDADEAAGRRIVGKISRVDGVERGLTGFGVALTSQPLSRQIFCRPCLDWRERRYHVAGHVGSKTGIRHQEAGIRKQMLDS
jgi:hypothetical protein